jgi:DNA-binding MarR family transcriptional regulator
MSADPAGDRLRLWLRLLAASSEMERALRRRLRREFGTTLPRFDVMAALSRAPEGLSMSELSQRLMVTNGNTTTIVGGLEKEGCVRRTVSPSDRRRTTVQLTESGREAFDRMASAHASWVSDLLAGLDAAPAEQLSQLLHDARLAIRSSAGAAP